MIVQPPGATMEAFGRCLTAQLGLRITADHWPALRGLFDGAAQPALHRWTGQPLRRAQVEALAERLAVGETYFFRDPAAFALLEHHVLPPLIEARRAHERRLRLWSAGCCTGEEAYSLAILVRRLLADLPRWDIEILGSDIHPRFLARAEEGVYGEWSFRGVDPGLRERHFDRHGDERWGVHRALQRLTRFAHLNLAAEHDAAGEFDVILCRHVLMYFEADAARQAVARLHRALAPGGWLLVGPTETQPELFADFETVRRGDSVIYRKPAAEPARAPAPSTIEAVAPPREDAALALAIRRCETAIAVDKCDASLHYQHALLLERARQPSLARAALRRVLFLDRRFVAAHLALGRLCASEGRSDLAQRHVGHARHAQQEPAR